MTYGYGERGHQDLKECLAYLEGANSITKEESIDDLKASIKSLRLVIEEKEKEIQLLRNEINKMREKIQHLD